MSHLYLNNILVLAKYFDKRENVRRHPGDYFKPGYPPLYFFYNMLEMAFPLFTGLYTVHGPSPFLKETFEEVWEKVSEIFDAENEAYEVLFELCGGRLEHAFDFMEAAFGSGQEMVVFVTGLNTGFYSVDFLQEYECQRYYQYNKMLLFDDREREILKQMES
jgi:hypothetical protein